MYHSSTVFHSPMMSHVKSKMPGGKNKEQDTKGIYQTCTKKAAPLYTQSAGQSITCCHYATALRPGLH
jgi:hypothetical protein